jgi:phosphoglycerate-specific signal transduction histidine kinase
MIDDGTWSRIESCVVKTWDDDFVPQLHATIHNEEALRAITDEMTAMIAAMNLH